MSVTQAQHEAMMKLMDDALARSDQRTSDLFVENARLREALDNLRKAAEGVESVARTEACSCGYAECDVTAGMWMGLDRAISDARKALEAK